MKKVIAFLGLAVVVAIIGFSSGIWGNKQDGSTHAQHQVALTNGGSIALNHEEMMLPVRTGEKKVVLSDLGMYCSSCHNAVAAALKKTTGVQTSFVNTSSDRATVVFDPQVVTIEQINASIKKSGFKVGDVKEIQS